MTLPHAVFRFCAAGCQYSTQHAPMPPCLKGVATACMVHLRCHLRSPPRTCSHPHHEGVACAGDSRGYAAGERLTFAAKLWADRRGDLLSPHTSRSPAPSSASDPPAQPLLLHAPPAAGPARSTQQLSIAAGSVAQAGGALPVQAPGTGQLMHREVATLRQDRDALLGAMKKLRAAFVRQVGCTCRFWQLIACCPA